MQGYPPINWVKTKKRGRGSYGEGETSGAAMEINVKEYKKTISNFMRDWIVY